MIASPRLAIARRQSAFNTIPISKLEGISSDLQTRLGVSDEERVIFARLEHSAYRDGIKFGNGKEISLQLLGSGVGATLIATAQKPQGNRERRVVLETVE